MFIFIERNVHFLISEMESLCAGLLENAENSQSRNMLNK